MVGVVHASLSPNKNSATKRPKVKYQNLLDILLTADSETLNSPVLVEHPDTGELLEAIECKRINDLFYDTPEVVIFVEDGTY